MLLPLLLRKTATAATARLAAPMSSSASSKFPPEGSSPIAPAESFISWDAATPVKIHWEDKWPANLPARTMHRMFRDSVEEYAGNTALADRREGANGPWTKWTYEDYYQDARAAAKAMMALGLGRFRGVGILGKNSPEWFTTSVAATMAGGLGVGLYQTSSPEIISYIGGHAPFDLLMVDDLAEFSRVLAGRTPAEAFPTVKKVVLMSPDASKDDSGLTMTWKDLIELGWSESDRGLDALESAQCANEACLLVYTSGTTGMPKGALLSHDNVTGPCKVGMEYMGFRRGQERIVSYLPACHIASLIVDGYMMMEVGAAVHFADKDALKGTLVENLKAVRPTILTAVPRVFEKIEERLQDLGRKNRGARKALVDWAKRAATEHHRRVRREGLGVRPSLSYWLAHNVIFRQIHKQLGIDAICGRAPAGIWVGGAPLRPATYDYFESLDVVLLELYGATETTTPVATNMHGPENKPRSVGKAGPGAYSKIVDPDPETGVGEIVCRSRNVFMGYHRDEERTREAFTDDAWYRTGDLGRFDEDGFLHISGRLKEIIITSGGKNLAPTPVEAEVRKELEEVASYVVVVGDRRKYLTCLITLRVEADEQTMQPTDRLLPSVRSWARRSAGLTREASSRLRTVRDFLTCPESDKLRAALLAGVERANSRAATNVSRVRRFEVLPAELSVAGGELSPTLKIKRFFVQDKYKDLIDRMYEQEEEPSSK